MRLSLSLHWALGVSLGVLLLLLCAATPTQSRFIAKRETLNVDMGALDAFTADPDIVNASSESSGLVRKPSSALEEQLELTTTTTSVPTEAAKLLGTAANASQELSQETVKHQLKSNVSESIREQQQEPEEQLQLKREQLAELKVNELQSTTTAATAVKPVDLESLQNKTRLTEELKENELQGTTTTTAAAASNVKPAEQQQRQETEQVMELTIAATTTTTTTTTEASTTTTERAASTQRSEDHARSMHYASSTESTSFPAAVTPMKLFALPMHTTKSSTVTSTSTSTTPPQLLAALLHAGVTVAPSASHENAIEEGEGEQLHPQPEKRGKFISDNSTNAQQLLLPNAAEVWSLAAMKMIPTTTTSATTSSTFSNNVEPRHNQTEEQHKEKNLLDWQQIMLMHENHTEQSMMSTTLDATEAATQPTTLRLDAAALSESEMETSASSSFNSNSEESNSNMAITAQEQSAKAKPKDEYAITEVLAAAVNAKPVNETVKPVELTELLKLTDAVTVTTTTTTTTETAATAEPELTTTTTSTTAKTTAAAPSSALNGTPHTNEMAMKATKEEEKEEEEAHENNENGDKTNDVDSDDVINVSVSVSVPTSETTTTTTTTTLAATERAQITVSTRTAGELSTTTEADLETTPPSTPTPPPTPTPSLTISHTPSTPRTVHAKVDEQLATTTITTLIINTTTPETVQISNEVNLDTITVKNVTKNNNENNLLLPESTTTTTTTTTTIPPLTTTTTIRTEEINNSETLQINNNSSENITETGTTTETTATTTSTTTTTTPPTVLLTDAKANSELTEHDNSLETNNIGEVILAITTTTSSTTTTAAAATTRTTTEASAAAGAANELEESTVTPTTTTTTTTTAAATSRTAIKPGELEEYDEDEDEQQQQQQIDSERVTVNKMADTTTTTTEATTTSSTTTTTTTPKPTTTTTEEPLISLLDDSSTTTTTTTTTTPIPITTTTTSPTTPTTRPTTTTTEAVTEPIYSSTSNNNKMLPIGETSTPLTAVDSTTPFFMPSPTELDHSSSNASGGGGSGGTDVNVIIAITVSIVGVIALILLVAFLYLMRKRQKQTSYGQRCRPVSLDAYSLDNVSVLGSVRRKGGRDATRASKRTYGNAAFDDPSLRHNLLSASELGKFVERRSSIFEEFRDVPQIIARADEVPTGCEDKNRYANVIPLPETRVVLQRQGDDDKTEYINANYVRGPRDAPNYYIACQAPLESTTGDFWRMIWEQQSRVIVQATDLNENGIERCAEYLPPSVTLDNHSNYGDYQVTLKHREVKDKYAISTLMLKRVDGDECRELTHYWYKWPETGVPLEEAPIIAMLLEARSSLKSYALEQANELKEKSSTLTLKSLDPAMDDGKKLPAEEVVSTSSGASNEINGNVTNGKAATRSQQGPLTIHCSPGTGRTGTIIACDMAIRSLETPKRSVDIPQLVYYVRRGRASAVQTKEQYEFIYKVANMYATKITNLSNDN